MNYNMNRKDAKKIAETITNEQIKEMLDRAKVGIADWTVVSIVNISCTKGTVWNILGKGFDVSKTYHILAKTNMVREYGEFLPDNLKPKKLPKQKSIVLFHQDPIF